MLIKDTITVSDREKTPEGYLKVTATLSRTGIQDYTKGELGLSGEPTDIVRVYRPDSEVFSDQSMQSFAAKPVTDDHPPQGVGIADFRDKAVGISGDTITREGNYTKARLTLWSEDMIAKIEAGKAEISLGYQTELELTPGTTPEGAAYDAVQRNIRGNHIAVVDAGRCGAGCRIADRQVTDCGGSCECASCQRQEKEDTVSDQPNKGSGFVVDGVPVDTLEDAKGVIGRLQERIAQDKDRMIELRTEVTTAMDKHRKRERELEDQLADEKSKTSAANLDKLAEDRLNVMRKAAMYLPDYETEGVATVKIARDAVAAACGDAKVAGKDDAYVLAAFDMLPDQPNQQGNAAAGSLLIDAKNGTGEVKLTGREAYLADMQNAYLGDQKGA